MESKCPGCGAGIEAITPFAWKGDGVETRFLCGSCSAKDGFTRSDRCTIADQAREIKQLRAENAKLRAGAQTILEQEQEKKRLRRILHNICEAVERNPCLRDDMDDEYPEFKTHGPFPEK